jgi:O-antigen/teichoic acid export membrane protein
MRYLAPIASRYGAVISQFAIVSLITHVLSLADAGRYFLFAAFIQTTFFAAGLGLPDGLVRYLPTLGIPRAQAVALMAKSAGRAAFLSFTGVAAAFGYALVVGGSLLIALLVALWWAGNGLIFICAQAAVAIERTSFGSLAFYSAANLGVLPTLLLGFGLGAAHSVESVLSLTATGTGVASAATLAYLGRIAGKESRKNRRPVARNPQPRHWHSELLKVGSQITLGRVVQALTLWTPVWVAGAMMTHTDVARIGLATRLVSAVAAILAAVKFSIRPQLARDAAADEWDSIARTCSRIASATTALALTALLGDLIVGQPLIRLAFGSNYGSITVLIAVFLIGTVGESVPGPADEVLRMSGGAAGVLRDQVVAAVLGVCLEVALAAWLGVNGIALGFSLAFCFYYGVQASRLWSRRGILTLPRLKALKTT